MKKIFSTLLTVALFISAFAQIPNAGFETWSNASGYNMPDGWDNLNPVTHGMSVYTCAKGTPGSPGTAYLKLVSKNVSGMGVMPGIATCGKLDTTTMMAPTALSGFAFTARPQTFDGKWQYMAYNGDQGYISVLLTKWDNTMMMRDTIAVISQQLQGMEMSWADFSLPFTYNNLQYPDTAFIILSASGTSAQVNSYLYADTLRFSGSVPGVSGISNNQNIVQNLSISPNPSHGIFEINCSVAEPKDIDFAITDLNGKAVLQRSLYVTNTYRMPLDITGVASGVYFMTLKSADGIQTQKLIVE